MNRFILLMTLVFLLIQFYLPDAETPDTKLDSNLYAEQPGGIEQVRKLLLKGDFTGAEKLLKELEATGSQAGEVNFYLGMVTLGSKELKKSQAVSIASSYFTESARSGYHLAPGTWENYPIQQERFLDANRQAAREHLKDKDPQKIQIAANLLLNIIAVDPQDFKEIEDLGQLYLRTGQIRQAGELYRRTLEMNPDKNQMIYGLRLDFLDIYQPEKANKIYDFLSSEDPANLSPMEKLLLARALFVLEEDSLAYDCYFRCLDSLDNVTAAELYRDITDIVFEEDRKNYEKAGTLQEKQLFFRRFWKAREPLPVKNYNERLVEHYRRLDYAKQNFHINMRNGYDDRGRIYIRHGEPDQKALLPSYQNENESWLYRKKPKDFIFHFLRRYTNYEIVPNLPPALYETRGELDPFYSLADMKYKSGMLSDADLVQIQMDETDLLMPAFTLGETTETYQPYRGIEPLDYYFYTADFMSINSNSSLYVYYGFPVSELELKPESTGTRIDYECTFAVFDQEWNEVNRAFDKRSYRLRPDPEKVGKGSLLIDNQIMNIPDGEYHYAVSVKDLNSNHLGVYKGDLEVTLYEHGKFNMSQIVLASGITRLESSSKPDKFARGGLKVMALPSVTFRQDQAVYIYCEIYYLSKDSDGRKRYNIDFSIQADKLDRNLVSKIFTSFGKLVRKKEEKERITLSYDKEQEDPEQFVQPEYITIDISDSPPGRYSLEISVTDSASGKKVVRNASFMVVKAG